MSKEMSTGQASDRAHPGLASVVLAADRRALAVRWLVLAGVLLTVAIGCAAAGVLTAYLYYAREVPSAEQLSTVSLAQSTKIYDRNEKLLYEVFDPQGGRRTLVRPEQIPPVLKQATIATEDPTFYANIGVDPYAIARAFYYNLRYGRTVAGGSTITQQLAKNVFLSPEPTLERKIREAMIAIAITRGYPKEEILAFYLNTIYYGNLAYGIQAASQSYFNKDVSQLRLAEASLLAGLPQAPARYDPCQNASAALDRQEVVLGLMIKAGTISEREARDAARETAALLASPAFEQRCSAGTETALAAPHFVNFVRGLLEKQFGPEVVYKGGLKVITTLDPRVQAIAEAEARKQIDTLRKQGASNTAIVVLEPHSGQLYAMLGSVDFFDKSIDGQVNVADRLRQPGSAIKPINYVAAFRKGWNPATPLYDLQTDFPNGDQAPYVPKNYDGREHGLVPIRLALGNSFNIPAVKTLYFVTVEEMIETARSMGITTFHDAQGRSRAQHFGLSLTLGGGDVKLIELAGAYAVFANQGTYIPPTPYLKITDGKGQVIYDLHGKDKPKPRCAGFDPGAPNEQPDANGTCARSAPYAYLITNILSDNSARASMFGANSPLRLSRPAAAKTGTSDDYRDNWTLGYTPQLVVGVWMGNSNNTPMLRVPGSLGAAPIWHNVMERTLNEVLKVPARDFPVPPGLQQATVCSESGLLATDLCPPDHRRTEIFVAGRVPTRKDTVWQKIKIDKRNGLRADDRCSPDQVAEELFQVPIHDVGDLIPYDRIVEWAKNSGWRTAPAEVSPCEAATPSATPSGTPTASPTRTRRACTATPSPTATRQRGKPTSTQTLAPLLTLTPILTLTLTPPATPTFVPPITTPTSTVTPTPTPC